jgi:hypothetical protein
MGAASSPVRRQQPARVNGGLLVSLEHPDLVGDADPSRPAGT